MPDKPIIYADIPEFNQETQYVVQSEPVDMGEYIYFGIIVLDMSRDEGDIK